MADAEKSPVTITLNLIEREQRNLKRKIGRAEESGDLARLLLYHAELEQIRLELDKMSVECAVEKAALPILRRSYSQEFFSEAILMTGRTTRRRLDRSTY